MGLTHQKTTLDDRAAELQELLERDGIEVSITEARDLLIADFLAQAEHL